MARPEARSSTWSIASSPDRRRQADGHSRCTRAAPRSTRRLQLRGSEIVTSARTTWCTEARCAVAGRKADGCAGSRRDAGLERWEEDVGRGGCESKIKGGGILGSRCAASGIRRSIQVTAEESSVSTLGRSDAGGTRVVDGADAEGERFLLRTTCAADARRARESALSLRRPTRQRCRRTALRWARQPCARRPLAKHDVAPKRA